MSGIAKPPYDPELAAVLAEVPLPAKITLEVLPSLRAGIERTATAELILSDEPINHEVRTIPGPGGDLFVSIFRPANPAMEASGHPGIYFCHGGGMIMANRFSGVKPLFQYIKECNAVCIAIEYRLAPEHPDPAPVEDCYAGLKWVGEHLEELNIDPKRLMIAGQSAGGGLAAGVSLLVRDKGGPALCAQMLRCPMLDDRLETISNKQFVNEGTWSSASNHTGWTALLGDHRGTDNVSIYAAPARAIDLAGLPSAFIDVGSCEVFRDEDVAYASKLWACGVQAELHVWPGGFHVFEGLAPTSRLSKIATTTAAAWVRRQFLPS